MYAVCLWAFGKLYITQFCFLNISETLVVQFVPAICPMVCSKYYVHLFAVIAFNFYHYSDVSIFTDVGKLQIIWYTWWCFFGPKFGYASHDL